MYNETLEIETLHEDSAKLSRNKCVISLKVVIDYVINY